MSYSYAMRARVIDDQIADHIGQRRSASVIFLLGIIALPVGIGFILAPWGLVNYFRHGAKIRQLQQERYWLMNHTGSVA